MVVVLVVEALSAHSLTSIQNLGSMGPEDLMKMRQELEKLELKLKSAMPGNG